MKYKLKKTLAMVMIGISIITIPVFAKTEKIIDTIFLGKVLEVENNEKDSNKRIRVKGYIKGCEVYEEELIAIVNKDTKVIKNPCNNGKYNKCELNNINIESGDTVYIYLDKAMTNSIPPQVKAREIQITKIKS